MTVEGRQGDPAAADKAGKPPVITVVLTPGRSGSSLLMEVLGNLGAAGLSDDLIPGRLENPHGFFEDARVVEIHKKLMSDLGARPGFPMPDGWLDEQVTRKAKRALTDLLRKQASAGPFDWAIKDPRISELLPLWLQVFNSARVMPRYILALRDPAVVVTSLRRTYNLNERLGELLWLSRTTQALFYSAGACFLLHYEDWFDRPGDLARGLAMYCGLGDISEKQAHEAVQAALEKRLDRSSWQNYEIRHPLVKELYALLHDCRGTQFNHSAVLAKVRETASLVDGFRHWAENNKAVNSVWEQKTKDGRKGAADGSGANGSDRGGAPKEIPDTGTRSSEVISERDNRNSDKAMKQASQTAEQVSASTGQPDVAELRKELTGMRQALKEKEAALTEFRRDLEELIVQNSRYLTELRRQYDLIEELRTRNSGLTQERDQLRNRVQRIKKKAAGKKKVTSLAGDSNEKVVQESRSVQRLQREVQDLRNSYSFRIGQAFADGLMKPGTNTIKLPFRVIGLLFSAFRNRKAISKSD